MAAVAAIMKAAVLAVLAREAADLVEIGGRGYSSRPSIMLRLSNT